MRTILDIAATGAGKRLCDWCGERVATVKAHDDIYGRPPTEAVVCEPCLEKAHDRQQERASENAP